MTTDFVTDLADLPPEKTDLNPLQGTIDRTNAYVADDYNQLRRAAYSLRTALLGGQTNTNAWAFLGDTDNAVIVPPGDVVPDTGQLPTLGAITWV